MVEPGIPRRVEVVRHQCRTSGTTMTLPAIRPVANASSASPRHVGGIDEQFAGDVSRCQQLNGPLEPSLVVDERTTHGELVEDHPVGVCLLYTSDAADDL